MAPLTPSRELLGPYSEALLAYLKEAQGPALMRARELGSKAVMSGICSSEMCAIHHESLRQIGVQMLLVELDGESTGHDRSADDAANPGASGMQADTMTAAGVFLGESLTAFEAKQREFDRSNLVLRRQNDKLESELRRISGIVYDQALQLLSAARLALAGCEGDLPPSVWTLLDGLEEQITSCSGELQPRVLHDLGLASAIELMSRRFADACKLEVTIEAAIGPLPAEVSVALYRSVLEALTNVHRHARASRVRIHLCEDCSMIQCSIRDDGIGFDISRALSEAEVLGSGFVTMQESLRLVGGTLVVDSVPGGGTELRISVCPRLQN